MKTSKLLLLTTLIMAMVSIANGTEICDCANTKVDIRANGSDEPITVCEGQEVTLAVCEENTGDVDLTNVYVELSTNGIPTGVILVAPPDRGDDGDDVLQPGETWCWAVDRTVTNFTIYGATGHGLDPAGIDITFPGYPTEYDEVIVETEPCGGEEGCTPGYWKNSPGCWECAEPGQSFSSIFGVVIEVRAGGKKKNTVTDPTLMQALEANGGGINALARHAVAALLNACDANIDYPLSVDQVIAAVQAEIPDGDIQGLKDELAIYNELGCPLSSDNAKNPCSPSDD